jgi:hypothetical protein
VSYFDIHSKEQGPFIFPFQMMGYFMCFFVLLDLYFILFQDDTSVSSIVVWIFCIFSPFYLPGLYHYACYRDLEQDTRLEVDSRHQMIKYSNEQQGENLLFHTSQVEHCQVSLSILFPYRIDYLTLRLKGGKTIYVSGLIASPEEILTELDLSYEVERRWFNPSSRLKRVA